MLMIWNRWRGLMSLVGLVAAVALLAAACGDDDDDDAPSGTTQTTTTTTDTAATTDRSDLSGSVAVDGSSTVFPVTEAVAEEFRSVAPDVRVTVGVSGTGGGFQKFCSGETDISDASRPIKDGEIEACAEAGIDYLELRVGLDGLAVVTHPETGFLECITMDELATLWSPDSEGSVTSWNQVRASWPTTEITLFGPDTDSGTFDFFTEEVNGEGGASRADYTNSTDDNVLVTGISGTEGASGYFGYAYYAENSDKLKVVAVDGGEGCIIPSDETVSNGSYVLARPLYIYVSTESLAEKPQVREFVRFYLSDDAITLVTDVGYTAIPADELATSRKNLEDAIAGNYQGAAAEDDEPAEELSGSVAVDGSSTVFPVTEAVAEEFRSVAPDVRVTVGVSGTGGGFQKFCAGETDISDASRPIKESEIEACDAAGIEYIPLRVGLDGLAVVAHPDTGFLECITMGELATLWSPDSEGSVTSWNQVRSSWPSEPITLFGPDTDSGTFDFFTEEVNGEGGASRADYTNSTDDNVLVTGISGTNNAAGYFGYAYYAENQDKLKVVAVDGGDGCVIPSDETVADGSYPLARPLFIYVSKQSLAEKPQVREFVRFYLSDEGIALVSQVGYTAIGGSELAGSRNSLESAIAGGG